MAIYYPRKQTIFIFVVCLITVSGAAYYAMPKQSGGVALGAGAIETAPAIVHPKDTGGTADAPDAQSAANSSDWKQQFVSSTTKQNSLASASDAQASTDTNLTLTDRMGREFFSQNVELAQSNLYNDTDSLNKVANTLVTDSFNAEKPKQYTAADIIISSSDDAATYQEWQAHVIDAFSLYNAQDSEALLAKEYLDTNDPKILTKIGPIVTMYGSIISKLLATPTPYSAEADMVNLVNSLSTLKFAAISMEQMENDPMLGMVGVKAFGDGMGGIDSAFVAIRDRLASHGLAFNVNPQVIQTIFEDQQ